jgi:GNAT superfamily N-acetyltransferase
MFTTEDKAAANYRQEINDGLIIRWSTAADADNIAQLTSIVFRDKEEEPPNQFMYIMTKLLLSGRSPLMGPGDYAIVEDPHKQGNPIVAGICLQRLTWEYDGIPFLMGRPEIVATDPAYRNRGLIRKLFDVIHARSAAEGRLLEGITGISYFYRQFGYEYALDLEGSQKVLVASIPAAKEGEAEAYTLREATIEDLPRIKDLYDQQRAKTLVSTQIDEAHFRWLLEGGKEDPERDKIDVSLVIVDTEHAVQGYLSLPAKRRDVNLIVWIMATDKRVNLQAMMPPVLRALKAYSEKLPLLKPDLKAIESIKFYLYETHPVYEALAGLTSEPERSYSWYIRISDLPKFIQHIAPALERRLIGSVVANYTGELKLNFYRDGIRLVFDKGHLTTVEKWRSTVLNDSSDGGFPPLVFYKALFGYRSLAELRHAYPDVWVNNPVLFNTLFPTQVSWALAL